MWVGLCVCVFVGACELDLTGLIFMEFYKDLQKDICGIIFMYFIYKFMASHFVYSLREHYYYSIIAFIISMRY
jgi:hypothetical protein